MLYINSHDMESLTGPQAIAKAVEQSLAKQQSLTTTVVHFKVSSQGITLTDNKRKWVSSSTGETYPLSQSNQPQNHHLALDNIRMFVM